MPSLYHFVVGSLLAFSFWKGVVYTIFPESSFVPFIAHYTKASSDTLTGEFRKPDGTPLSSTKCEQHEFVFQQWGMGLLSIAIISLFMLFLSDSKARRKALQSIPLLLLPSVISLLQTCANDHYYVGGVAPLLVMFFFLIAISLLLLVFIDEGSSTNPPISHLALDLVDLFDFACLLTFGLVYFAVPSYLISPMFNTTPCSLMYVTAKQVGGIMLGIALVKVASIGTKNGNWRLSLCRSSAAINCMYVMFFFYWFLNDVFNTAVMASLFLLYALLVVIESATFFNVTQPTNPVMIKSKKQ